MQRESNKNNVELQARLLQLKAEHEQLHKKCKAANTRINELESILIKLNYKPPLLAAQEKNDEGYPLFQTMDEPPSD